MWTKAEFVDFLWSEGHGDVWETTVVPGMKKAILCSLLCTQEFIECRKLRLHFIFSSPAAEVHMYVLVSLLQNAFEIYGADFMLTTNFQPWLLEINSSPSMARSTKATSLLVEQVLGDMLKGAIGLDCHSRCIVFACRNMAMSFSCVGSAARQDSSHGRLRVAVPTALRARASLVGLVTRDQRQAHPETRSPRPLREVTSTRSVKTAHLLQAVVCSRVVTQLFVALRSDEKHNEDDDDDDVDTESVLE